MFYINWVNWLKKNAEWFTLDKYFEKPCFLLILTAKFKTLRNILSMLSIYKMLEPLRIRTLPIEIRKHVYLFSSQQGSLYRWSLEYEWCRTLSSLQHTHHRIYTCVHFVVFNSKALVWVVWVISLCSSELPYWNHTHNSNSSDVTRAFRHLTSLTSRLFVTNF